ncbi:MAG: hypothetical protein O3B64_01135 [bacterium]|nr:hypothetical protein [bacterium]MDA1024709.1 hypothetical protein [bacterium]
MPKYSAKPHSSLTVMMTLIVFILSVTFFLLTITAVIDDVTPISMTQTAQEQGAYAGPVVELRFSSDEPDSLLTKVQSLTAGDVFTADGLYAQSEECGTNRRKAYYEDLMQELRDVPMNRYNFMYTGASQLPSDYIVSVMPNEAGYESLEEFKLDFNLCFAGGDYYPTALDVDYLYFASSCGTGFGDGSTLPVGCAEAKRIVETETDIIVKK